MPELRLDGIDWVIAGGECGPRARPMSEEWVLDIRDHCIEKGVAFFFKQWDGSKRKSGRLLQGRTWDEYPGQRSIDDSADVYEYINCLTSEEKSTLLMKVPQDQSSQLLRDAALL